MRGIGVPNPIIQNGILDILVVVIGIVLPHGIRGIPHNHPNLRLILPCQPRIVLGKHLVSHEVLAAFPLLERIGQHNSRKRFIILP